MKQLKWYWYIPVIGMFFLKNVSEWIFEPDNYNDRLKRDTTILYTWVPAHILYIILICTFIKYFL